KGDTEVFYDGHTATLYDASSNTVYRYTPQKQDGEHHPRGQREVPSVAQIEEAISHLERHASVSPATPSNVAGQPAYTVRVAPSEGGSLLAGAELSWDADNGVPLRAALYSTKTSSAVVELAASEVSFEEVPGS